MGVDTWFESKLVSSCNLLIYRSPQWGLQIPPSSSEGMGIRQEAASVRYGLKVKVFISLCHPSSGYMDLSW